MKLRTDMKINGKYYKKGAEIPGLPLYGFFGIHMLAFGAAGFFIAYSDINPDIQFLYMHGGLAIFVYMIFYLAIFGLDEVKWMFINAGLGILGIYSQIDWLLSLFGRQLSDFPLEVHVIPFLYFILYTFLLRQALLDITRSRDDESRKKYVEYGYIVISLAVYLSGLLLHEDVRSQGGAVKGEYVVVKKRHFIAPAGVNLQSKNNKSDKVMTALQLADTNWDKRRYAEAYRYYEKAYQDAVALDLSDGSRNRKLAFSSSGIMATACTLGKWEIADKAMAELKERYKALKPENQKKMDYWIRTGEPRLKKRQC